MSPKEYLIHCRLLNERTEYFDERVRNFKADITDPDDPFVKAKLSELYQRQHQLHVRQSTVLADIMNRLQQMTNVNEASVLDGYYLKGLSPNELAESYHKSLTVIYRHKSDGLKHFPVDNLPANI